MSKVKDKKGEAYLPDCFWEYVRRDIEEKSKVPESVRIMADKKMAEKYERIEAKYGKSKKKTYRTAMDYYMSIPTLIIS